MPETLLKRFDDRTTGFKLSILFLLVILIPMTLMAYVSYRVIDAVLSEKAEEKISIGLKAAWTEYYTRAEQLRYGMLQAAASEDFIRAVKARDKGRLREMMAKWKSRRPYVDIWSVVDSGGRVIARLSGPSSGDALGLNGLVKKAVEDGEPKVSTEILTREVIRNEGDEVNEKIITPSYSAEGFQDGASYGYIKRAESAMALSVVVPVSDPALGGRRALGAIVTAVVLNNDSFVSDAVADKMPGLFTTISMNGTRIATNLIDSHGQSIKNTTIPDPILALVSKGPAALKGWSIDSTEYVSSFDPIKDNRGAVIGALDVSMAKESLWMLQKRNQQVIAFITFIGVTVSIAAALISTYRITRPLNALKEKMGAFAAGDRTQRVKVEVTPRTRDEIKILAMSFNAMMDEVGRREEDRDRYLGEIEGKNTELGDLNEEFKKKNEEVELAYEELQSQTEELQAINEELKILNEDLDRKNDELKSANLLITKEEEDLKRAKDRLRLVYDSVTDYLLVVDYDHVIREANRRFSESFAADGESVIGRKVYPYFGLDKPVKECAVRRAIDSKEPAELEMTLSDGRVVNWRAFPLLEDGGARKAVVYIKDITGQRLLMQKLAHSDKLSSLGELVSGVAHELNNPLTAVICFSELMLADEKLGAEEREKIRKINEASIRCRKIIANLLTFARWQRPEKRYFDINKVITESVELRANQMRLDNVEVRLGLGEVPRTMLDCSQLQQVFLNLINNAVDAIKETGRPGSVSISSRQRGERIVIDVEDTGKGIPAEIAARIFDPFFTTKEVGRGTGLGLSISYGIIREHGGEIYASSGKGGGAVFTVELPVVEEIAPEVTEDLPSYSEERLKERARGQRALIVDDEAIVLDVLEKALTSSGFSVEKTESAREALRMITDLEFDLIISDIKMPGLGGKELYGEVKRIRPGMLKKILFITGDSLNKETEAFLSSIGGLSLRKPFTLKQLKDVILRQIS